MIRIQIRQKLKKEKNVIFVNEISYNNEKYVKTLKLLENGIEYIYYRIENEEIKDVKDEEILFYFKNCYEIHEGRKFY